ncbi:flagellar basal-body MS-ring/collar protein FliF [Fredinandcohnia quinoae]|uniref:Flagellar M-ring protein n=1 Tax=Fredinandcohnia quinoae TaxID=2918902 RepID=A0AAW5E0Y8_9BACI|nr:flagellar basal-body MS-ring/collar protein FliF [Fredinandcohnia sp. SECRCQ15]MCH1623787.1 flagellar M-ring protein FliF [Fredinandcohnia sp. SECRCQ15]
MNEKLNQYKNRIVEFWKKRSSLQKGLIIGGPILVILLLTLTVVITSKQNLVPLYTNLSVQETGQIKATLDSKGIKSEIADNGKTIKVPEEMVQTLMVDLAAEGIPDSGNIDYSFFAQNSGFGMTDNEFNVMKLEATQTELSNLIKGFEGVNDASVMITVPEQGIFVTENKEEASAAIRLNTKPGYKFDQEQIKSLYHLVSKSVPNLPTDNIVITNQYFEYFDLENEEDAAGVGNIASQLDLKHEVERDIQRQVQQMLGTMMGQDKVVVSVTTDIDFSQENRHEDIVTPVDPENNEGIDISVERITETFTGNGAQAGGTAVTGDADIPGYVAGDEANNGDYEKVEERVNKEVNRIKKDIVEAPYKIRDLGIQVMVEAPNPEDPSSLPNSTVEDIEKILSTIVRTSVNKDANEQLTEDEIKDKIVVSVQKFNGKQAVNTDETSKAKIPLWIYIVGGVLVVLLIVVLVLLFRKKKNNNIEETIEENEDVFFNPIPDVNEENESEASVRRKQLEKMAKDKPDDFAKLLRSWLTED